MMDSWFLTCLSMKVIRQAACCGLSPCLLAFLSLQTQCMVVWNTYLAMKSFVLGRRLSEMVETRVSQSVEKCDRRSFLVRAVQTLFENTHWKNRWFRVSVGQLQRTHDGFAPWFHFCMRSPVDKRSWIANQQKNAYLGVDLENQHILKRETTNLQAGAEWRVSPRLGREEMMMLILRLMKIVVFFWF